VTDHTLDQLGRPLADKATRALEQDVLATLFDLGRRVMSVLDTDELLAEIPRLVSRLIAFQAFGIYLLDARRGELRLSHGEGYPESARGRRVKTDVGVVGAAVVAGQPRLVPDVSKVPEYVPIVPGMQSQLVVPLRHKNQPIGALNMLGDRLDQFSETDLAIVLQFGAHVAVALANARLFEQVRVDAEALETLAEIGRDVASVLDLDALFERIAQQMRRIIDYRTFGILLVNEERGELEMKLAVKYGEKVVVPRMRLGEGLVGHAALFKESVLVSNVSRDPRYIKVIDDVRSQLAIPMLLGDRCIGVFDLESPELDAFTRRDVKILELLASQAAVAIGNARLYERVRDNEERLEKELRFAQRVQAALLPTELPTRLKGVDVAASFAAARELGGDFHDLLTPESNTLIVAVGDVSGKGTPAALYSVFAGELVRSRTFRRRYLPEKSSPAGVLLSINTILHQRQLEEYYATLCYAVFDLKRRQVTLANSGLPYPVRCAADGCAQIVLPGVPLGSFFGSTYDEVSVPLQKGNVFVFCSDGVFEAMDREGREFGAERLIGEVGSARDLTARQIVDRISEAVAHFRDGMPPNDDMTIVAVRITT
jgi:sigma-B regulation protein RsbU (phosphoserine phosphatase)